MALIVENTPYRGPTFYPLYEIRIRNNGTVSSEYTSKIEDPIKTRVETVSKGESQPNWKEKIRKRQNATTPLTGTRYQVEHQSNTVTEVSVKDPSSQSPVSVGYIYNVYPIVVSSDYTYPSPTVAGGVSLTNARNQAKMRFLKKLMATQRSFQGSIAVGELRETISMILHPAKALRTLVSPWSASVMKLRQRVAYANRRRPPKYRIREIRKATGDAWLENAFGWQPLLNDIDDAAKALAKLGTRDLGEFISANGSDETESTAVIGYVTGSNCRIGREVRKPLVADVRYFGYAKGQVSGSWERKADLLGFNLQRDFAPTLWELTPWSFLIDYFVNIGDLIDSYSWGRYGLSWCNEMTRREASFDHRYRPYPYGLTSTSWSLTSSQNGRFRTKTTLVTRAVYGGNFVPDISFRVPGVGNKKWLNVAALAAGRRTERKFRLF